MSNVATPRDRDHFAAIAAAETEAEEERFVRAATSSPGERMILGIELGAEMPWTPSLLAEIDADADGQAELARRRIALNLGIGAGG